MKRMVCLTVTRRCYLGLTSAPHPRTLPVPQMDIIPLNCSDIDEGKPLQVRLSLSPGPLRPQLLFKKSWRPSKLSTCQPPFVPVQIIGQFETPEGAEEGDRISETFTGSHVSRLNFVTVRSRRPWAGRSPGPGVSPPLRLFLGILPCEVPQCQRDPRLRLPHCCAPGRANTT